MDYRIEIGDEFTVIGKDIELEHTKSRNVQISKEFWKQFNRDLKKAYIIQYQYFLKYAFTQKRDDKLFYYCAVSKKSIVPTGFIEKKVCRQEYLVVEHIGDMNRIYDTYDILYRQVLPQSRYKVDNKDFLHFERYDQRFHWNDKNSVIEIWVPIMD